MIQSLFDNNLRWAARLALADPDRAGQRAAPVRARYLWIGCSDNATPPHELVGLDAGEVVFHSNVGNLAPALDVSLQAQLQFALDVLRVQHIIVCGHYGCGAIQTALSGQRHGLVDHWLAPVCALERRCSADLAEVGDTTARANLLCERNVLTQVAELASNPFVRDAWRRGMPLALHGWIYSPHDGLIRDLETSASSAREADRLADAAGQALAPARRRKAVRR